METREETVGVFEREEMNACVSSRIDIFRVRKSIEKIVDDINLFRYEEVSEILDDLCDIDNRLSRMEVKLLDLEDAYREELTKKRKR